MSVTVLALAALLASSAPAAVDNQNHCWQDSGRSGPGDWGRYDYHLVNRCDRTIQVWDAVVLWRDDGLGRWTCGHGASTGDESVRSGCRPLVVEPGATVSYTTRSSVRYWWFACYPDNEECNELGKTWADRVDGLSRSFDPGEVARSVGASL